MLRSLVCAAVLASASLSLAQDSRHVVVGRDGHVQLSLPEGWTKLDHVYAAAQIEATNPSKHDFAEIITENAGDFSITLEQYADHCRKAMSEKMDDAHTSNLTKAYVNGAYAVRFELHGVVGKVKMKAGYIITVMKLGNRYVQVICWTGESYFADAVSDMNDLPAYVTEVKR